MSTKAKVRNEKRSMWPFFAVWTGQVFSLLGTELVQCALPCLLTVVGTANQPRPASARKRIANKLAASPLEYKTVLENRSEFETEAALDDYLTTNNLKITTWSAADVGAEGGSIGLAGSPTQVYKVNFVKLEATDSKDISPDQASIAAMIEELIQEYVVG